MSGSRIGVNTVFTDFPDEELFYIRDHYLSLLNQYSEYLDLVGYLEFSHVVNITPDDAVIIGNRARTIGFAPWSIHSEHLNQGGSVEEYLKIQTHEAEVCAALGCQVMVCHLPNLDKYVDFERDLDVIGKVAEITRKNNVKLAVETCGYSLGEHAFLPDADLVLSIVEALNRDDVGINLDSGHCFIGLTEKNPQILEQVLSEKIPQTLPGLVKRIGKKLFTTHLHDNFGLNDDHQAPGFGYIDWETLVPAILETGYQGPLMMELTGMGVKSRRTVPQLRKYPLKKEVIFSASYLNHLLKSNRKGNNSWNAEAVLH